jgi:hypothetical protein
MVSKRLGVTRWVSIKGVWPIIDLDRRNARIAGGDRTVKAMDAGLQLLSVRLVFSSSDQNWRNPFF